MSKSADIVNSLLVEMFHNVLDIEKKFLQKQGIEDLSLSEIHTVEAIGPEGSKTMTETAEILKITLGTLTTAINRLVKKGYVQRRKELSDRRVVKVFLTARGRQIYRIHETFHEQMVKRLIEDLDLEEESTLVTSLGKLKDFFDTHYEPGKERL